MGNCPLQEPSPWLPADGNHTIISGSKNRVIHPGNAASLFSLSYHFPVTIVKTEDISLHSVQRVVQ